MSSVHVTYSCILTLHTKQSHHFPFLQTMLAQELWSRKCTVTMLDKLQCFTFCQYEWNRNVSKVYLTCYFFLVYPNSAEIVSSFVSKSGQIIYLCKHYRHASVIDTAHVGLLLIHGDAALFVDPITQLFSSINYAHHRNVTK